MYMKSMEAIQGQLNIILPLGEKLIVSPYGNHARGALFVDDSHLVNDSLRSVMDDICRQIPEFYYGRLDIRYNSFEELCAGKQFR
jgi:hypothetical protein